jgi:prevent-host-death family protein
MQTKQWSLQDAKNKFSALVDEAQKGKAQVVTRRGVPAAVVLSIEEFEKFQRFEAAQSPSFRHRSGEPCHLSPFVLS